MPSTRWLWLALWLVVEIVVVWLTVLAARTMTILRRSRDDHPLLERAEQDRGTVPCRS